MSPLIRPLRAAVWIGAVGAAIAGLVSPCVADGAPPARAAGAAKAPDFKIALGVASVVASDAFMWTLPIEIMNSGATGLYSDSLNCDIERLDPGLPERARHSMLPLWNTPRLAPAVSAGETSNLEMNFPASAERARLTLHYYGHRADGTRLSTSIEVNAEPGPLLQQITSEFVTVGGHRVEYVRWMASADTLTPVVLYLPGDDHTARSVFRTTRTIEDRGISVFTVSFPGRGQSEGRGDAASNLAAAAGVLEALRHAPGVDARRIAIWGVQDGAAVAARLAAREKNLSGLICEAGCYDASCGTTLDAAVLRQHTPTLVLHGAADTVATEAQAVAFAAALKAGGADARAQSFPMGHEVRPTVMRPALDFLQRQFRP